MCDVLTIKMFGSGIDQNKKSLSFWPIDKKIVILHEKLEILMARENFPLKKSKFWPMGQIDGFNQCQSQW